jgi:NTP pyrophosphatase (non-canonical NTP hydrolase)
LPELLKNIFQKKSYWKDLNVMIVEVQTLDLKKDVQNASTAEVVNVDNSSSIEEMGEFERIKTIAEQNTVDYTILKTCEELAELQEKLLKFYLKVPTKKPSLTDIAEEIGDVVIRIGMLVEKFPELDELTEIRIEAKIEKLWEYYKSGKYIGGV